MSFWATGSAGDIGNLPIKTPTKSRMIPVPRYIEGTGIQKEKMRRPCEEPDLYKRSG